MSYLLRHGSTHEKVHMDSQKYVTMAALLEWLNKDLRHHLDSEEITWIVDNNDKVRFSIDPIKYQKYLHRKASKSKVVQYSRHTTP